MLRQNEHSISHPDKLLRSGKAFQKVLHLFLCQTVEAVATSRCSAEEESSCHNIIDSAIAVPQRTV